LAIAGAAETRGLTTTEAGLDDYERARGSIKEAGEAETAARGTGSALTGGLHDCGAVTFTRIHLGSVRPVLLASKA
jgi:hypothetical protein